MKCMCYLSKFLIFSEQTFKEHLGDFIEFTL